MGLPLAREVVEALLPQVVVVLLGNEGQSPCKPQFVALVRFVSAAEKFSSMRQSSSCSRGQVSSALFESKGAGSSQPISREVVAALALPL